MKRITFAAMSAALVTLGWIGSASAGPTLDAVKQRGTLNCGFDADAFAAAAAAGD